jgi:hypothetical protein
MTNLTNLTVKEQVLISSMNERLKRLEELYFSKGQETKQPIDTTEGEYVRCIEWNGELYTAGKIYQVVNGIIIDDRGFNDDYADLIKHQPFFEPATHAEFLAQEQAPIETEQRWKPNVNDIYWTLRFDNGRCIPERLVSIGDLYDLYRYENNNCFKSEQEAQKAAKAIKQYLSTNKF